MISKLSALLSYRIRRWLIRMIRRYQDHYVTGMSQHQEVYNDLDERSFNAMYREMMISFYKILYWFCVANARFK